jgi:hypothetical protein
MPPTITGNVKPDFSLSSVSAILPAFKSNPHFVTTAVLAQRRSEAEEQLRLIYRLFYQIDRENSPRPGQSLVCGRALSKTHSNRHFRFRSILLLFSLLAALFQPLKSIFEVIM